MVASVIAGQVGIDFDVTKVAEREGDDHACGCGGGKVSIIFLVMCETESYVCFSPFLSTVGRTRSPALVVGRVQGDDNRDARHVYVVAGIGHERQHTHFLCALGHCKRQHDVAPFQGGGVLLGVGIRQLDDDRGRWLDEGHYRAGRGVVDGVLCGLSAHGVPPVEGKALHDDSQAVDEFKLCLWQYV